MNYCSCNKEPTSVDVGEETAGFNPLPGVPAPHQKVGMEGRQGGIEGGEEGQRQFTPYEPGPPLSYMERIAEKRQLEEVCLLLTKASHTFV